jgi:formamidopyrimidine-DNA glycosylase
LPELPEVESMRLGILAVVGRRIEGVAFPRGRRQSGLPGALRPLPCTPSAGAIRRSLTDRNVLGVNRAGKRVVLALSGGRGDAGAFLVIEPRMTGLLLTESPPTASHVRLRIRFAGSPPLELLFWDRRGLGTLALLDARGLERTLGAGRLGPDALSIDAARLRRTLGDSRRPLKAALLDQRAVAGIGNIYACECLFTAGIDPRTPCRNLERGDWKRLAAAIRSILADAVACGGSTLPDATYLAGPGRPGTYQIHHRVYGREGLACPTCGSAIRRFVQAQRSTFFCPTCQGTPRHRPLAATGDGGIP